jgi:hypothetical protein
MNRIWLAFWIFVLAACGVADARITIGVFGAATGGGSVTPPSCTNALDFTQACNSQYLGTVVF